MENLYSNEAEFCYSASKEEIKNKNYTLIPSKYIEFIDHDLDIDYENDMKKIQSLFKSVISDEKESQKSLEEAFEVIGYGIK